MPIRTGNVAEGQDFFDRLTELDDLWRALDGNHVVLSGPRRLGKTSLLKRLCEQAAERGFMGRLVDVQGLDQAEAFIAELERAFPDESVQGHLNKLGRKAAELLGRLKVGMKLPGGMGGSLEIQALPDVHWRNLALKVQERLSNAPALLLIDEFSVFLEKLIARDIAEAERLLAWLRAWRLRSGVACRFVYSGSVGINALLERHRLPTLLNDCHEFKLGPFRPKPAREMLATLCAREKWEVAPETLDHICRRTGWLSPFYLNLLLDESLKAGRDRLLETPDGVQRLLTTDVDDAYDRLLASRSRFIHWYQRLQRDLDEPELSFHRAVLRHVAKADDGLTQPKLLARLARIEPDSERRRDRLSTALLYLEENGYVSADGGPVRFLSFLLRDYWRRNHGA